MRNVEEAFWAAKKLADYPVGTWISIGERVFRRIHSGVFWCEEHASIKARISRPSISLAWIEQDLGISHVVFHKTEAEVFKGDLENLAQETCTSVNICLRVLTENGGNFNRARRFLLNPSELSIQDAINMLFLL
jgi:hypothetical protein